MLFALDSGGQQFGLDQLGSSSLFPTGVTPVTAVLVVSLGLDGQGWPHSHGWRLVLAVGWASLSMWSLILN